MRADQYLTAHGYYESRARAQAAIKAGLVIVNGQVLTKPSQKILEGAELTAEQEHPYVSRGALKLAHALKVFEIDPTGRACLDIGSSTGGFSEVLVEHGAAVVYAVDVGTDQLHPRLRDEPKIISMENMDARQLSADQFKRIPDLLVCDASFIPVSKVLQRPLSFLKLPAEAVILVKPQFELGRAALGKGGIVNAKDGGYSAVRDVSDWLDAKGWSVVSTTTSPIKGGSGNTEFLLHAIKKAPLERS